MEAMLKIGVDKDGIDAVKDALIAILGCGQDQATIQKALDVFAISAKVENITVSNNLFTTGVIDDELIPEEDK